MDLKQKRYCKKISKFLYFRENKHKKTLNLQVEIETIWECLVEF